ncbi:MAG: zinc ribbon domain-containing protein [Acidobacteriia bacterium]|jgi:putative FmdB family regulatory protein|nr:zinc ribbon domain-containing protein [Terriglobia bacterium]
MPIYEYKCQSCGKVFERIQRFADSPLTTHDDCGGTVDRLVSAPAFHLKGSGWYATDYAKGGSGGPIKPTDTSSSPSSSDNKGSDSSAESKSEAKSEAKTESKTESKPSASESKPASSSSSSDSK